MPDITMCDDAECPNSNQCYRFLAKPSSWQSYFVGSPRENNVTECDHFWLHRESEIDKKKEKSCKN